ncbi:MAG TPA: ABC transporter substrate-binding protein, partial [Thermomicrobiales bacterium]|nr:ABC transporter substrate-binding protein [Thermomicrobiales bacterium]
MTTANRTAFQIAFEKWSEDEIRHLVASLTRRRFVGTAATIAALAGLPAAARAQTPVASPVGGTRTVDTVNGPVEVPANPTRVVCIDSYSITALIDAGLTPIGIPAIDLDSYISVYKDALVKVPTVGSYQGIDVEKIKTLNPEVILAINAPWATSVYDQLKEIAPTVVFDYAVPNAWQVLADEFTGAIGRTDELDVVKKTYADATNTMKTTYADQLASLTWAVANGWGSADNQYTLYFPDSAPGVVLSDSGVTWIDPVTGKTGTSELISYERLDQLVEADIILTYGERDGTPNADS